MIRRIILSIFLLLSFTVQAETIPATVQGRLWSGGYTAGSAPYQQKLEESCRAALTANMSPAPTCVVVATGPAEPPTASSVNAWMQFTCSYYSNHTAPQGGGCGTFYPSGDAYVCPANQGWTLSGTNCTRPDCPTGYTRDVATGQCMPPTCPAAGSSAMVGGAAAWKISGGSAACVAGFSYSGCAVKCTSGASSGGSAACTGCSFTGAPGDASSPNGTPVPAEQKTNPTTPEGCLSSGKGYITGSTGITTCISGTEAPASQPVQTTEKTKTTTTNEQGQSTTTEGTKTTECSGGNCTETTSSSGPNGTSTVAEEKPASNFCSENPSSPMCKEAKDPCEDHPDRVGCLDKGEPEDGDALPTEDRGVTSVTPVSFSSAASCPADVQLPKGAKLSYAYPCQMATSLRPIILAIAWLIAGFIVMGAFRDG